MVRSFSARFSDLILRGNRRWRGEMLAVCSGHIFNFSVVLFLLSYVQMGSNNSQHFWANNVGSCCVRVGSGLQTDATTTNNTQQDATRCANGRSMWHPTMLGVVGQLCFVRLHGALLSSKLCPYECRVELVICWWLSLGPEPKPEFKGDERTFRLWLDTNQYQQDMAETVHGSEASWILTNCGVPPKLISQK